jgi:nucleoside-diphosphate-sugar epimerase
VILVTGASGFIGQHCVAVLHRAGHPVLGLSRSATAAQCRKCDLLDLESLRNIIADVQPTHVLHCAWETTPGSYWSSPTNLTWLAATLELVQALAARGRTRFVGVGSCAEYAWGGDLMSERSTPLLPGTLYGAAKAAAFLVGERVAALGDVSFAWARLFHLYGPHERPGRLVPDIVRSLLDGQPAKCTAGRQRRDFIHVEDAACALVALLLSDVQGAVNIGSGEETTVGTLVHMIGAATGRAELVQPGSLPDRPGDPDVLLPDLSRLNAEVGWRAARSLSAGVSQTVAWWSDQHA